MTKVKRLAALSVLALILAPMRPLAAATIVAPHPELGRLLVLSDEAQVYVRADAQFAIFTGVLPTAWSYSVNVDGDQNGQWGEGPVPDRDRRNSPSSPDFSYGTSHGTLCSQYIYNAYQNEPDVIYASSVCGARKSAATFQADSVAQGVTLQTFTIPKSELRNGPGAVQFAIEIWNGTGTLVFGSPGTPFVLVLAP